MTHANDIPFAKYLDSIRAPCRHNIRHLLQDMLVIALCATPVVVSNGRNPPLRPQLRLGEILAVDIGKNLKC